MSHLIHISTLYKTYIQSTILPNVWFLDVRFHNWKLSENLLFFIILKGIIQQKCYQFLSINYCSFVFAQDEEHRPAEMHRRSMKSSRFQIFTAEFEYEYMTQSFGEFAAQKLYISLDTLNPYLGKQKVCILHPTNVFTRHYAYCVRTNYFYHHCNYVETY